MSKHVNEILKCSYFYKNFLLNLKFSVDACAERTLPVIRG